MSDTEKHSEPEVQPGAAQKSGNTESGPISLFQWMGYLALLTVLTIPYIYNAHRSEKIFRLKEKLIQQSEELRSEYITLKSAVIGQHKQSDITRKLSDRNLQELSDPPIDLNQNLEH